MNDTLYATTHPSPVGPLTIVASDAGVRAIMWPDDTAARVPTVDEPILVESNEHPVLASAVVQLDQYFAGERHDFDVPLDAVGTDFQQAAWRALRTIPYGETVSYGQQAERMGDKRKARAVGAANGRNPISIIVPCHRVVGANGSLTGFAGGIDTKAWLLQHEASTSGTTLPF